MASGLVRNSRSTKYLKPSELRIHGRGNSAGKIYRSVNLFRVPGRLIFATGINKKEVPVGAGTSFGALLFGCGFSR